MNAAAGGVGRSRAIIAAELAAARAQLAATQEDVRDLDAARARLAAVRRDPQHLAAVAAAESALAGARERWTAAGGDGGG